MNRWLLFFTAVAIALWALFIVFAVFSHAYGYGYVPSTDWASSTSTYRMVAGVIGAVLMEAYVIRDQPVGIDKDFKKLMGVLGAPFIGYFLGSAPILAGGPMLAAMIAGHHTEITYKVTEADKHGSRGCYSPIELQGLPWFFDKLCGVPDDLRENFKPNMQIVVEGRGTSLGIYATALHRVRS